MELGVSVEPLGTDLDGREVLHLATAVERAGLDYVHMSGHVLRNGLGSALDPVALLATVAGATSRVRLATSILVLPYWNPVLLANQAATVDVLSGGRFVLAVGSGWNAEEFAAVGVSRRERGARTDEALELMAALWRGGPVDFAGRFTTLRGAELGVRPVTAGGPPVWVGGHSDAALLRALRFGAGWHASGIEPDAVAGVRARLAALGERVGRDPAGLALTTVGFLVPPGFEPVVPLPGHALGGPAPTAGSVVDELGRLAEAGMSACALWMPVAPAAAAEAVEWVAAEVRPALDRPA